MVAQSQLSNLLLVEGDAAGLRALEEALEPLGQRLVKASSGEAALEHLLREQFAVLVLDGKALGDSGLELVRRLRRRAPHLPLLLLGHQGHDAEQLQRALEAGASDCLPRPFAPALLRAKVEVFLHLEAARQRAEQQLGFQESILRSVQDSIIVTDLSGHITHWSHGAQGIFGYGSEEMLGKTPQHLYAAQDAAVVGRDLERILDGEAYTGEWRGRHKDGSFLWLDIQTRVLRDAAGKVTGFIGVGKDITAQKRAEQKLRFLSDVSRLLMEGPDELDPLLQRVAELAAGPLADLCVVDLLQEDGMLRRVSVAHSDPDRRLLSTGLRLAPRPAPQNPILQVAYSGKACLFADAAPLLPHMAQSAEHLQLLKELGIHSLMVVPLQGQNKMLGLLSLAKCAPNPSFGADDLELAEELARRAASAMESRRLFRDAQQALLRAEKEKRTAEIFSRLGLAFASELDRDKLLQRITDEATELTGAAFGAFFHNLVNDRGESYLLYTLSGVPREAFSSFPMPRNTAIFAPTFEGKGTVRLEDVTHSPQYGHNAPYHGMPKGHLPVRSYLAVPVRSRSGGVLGGLFFGHPEPGRFRKEHEQLVEGLAAQAAVALDNSLLYHQAQLAVSLRDEFLQVAAHELRTPTTSLKLHVQSLLRAAQETGPVLSADKLRVRLEGVERIAGKLSVLINELLDISRITAGSLHLTWEQVDLASVIREVVLRFEAQAAQARSELHVATGGPLVGHWDRLRLEQVVTNLLSNAIKYGAGKQVSLEARATSTHARLTVRDEGIGIAPEALPRLFGRFERAVSERHYGGLGLGLYITRQIVEALGGTVRVESAPGQGATFTVELPLEPPGATA